MPISSMKVIKSYSYSIAFHPLHVNTVSSKNQVYQQSLSSPPHPHLTIQVINFHVEQTSNK